MARGKLVTVYRVTGQRPYATFGFVGYVGALAGLSSAGVTVSEANPMEILEKNDRLMELILDISNELDIDVLCHKMLLNVGRLTQADRCSLFLARGPRDKRYLEAKLFDVEATTSKLEEFMQGVM